MSEECKRMRLASDGRACWACDEKGRMSEELIIMWSEPQQYKSCRRKVPAQPDDYDYDYVE